MDEQLARFVAEHTDTKLIIIDTLQKVREVGGDNYSYANDYQIMARLKSFADATVLYPACTPHKEQTADDKFDMISGTSDCLVRQTERFSFRKKNGQAMQQLWKYQAGISKTKNYTLSVIRKLCCGAAKGRNRIVEEPPEPLLDEIAELVMKDISSWKVQQRNWFL